jgi:transposase
MARDTAELTDEQWEKIAPLLPAPHAAPWGGPNPLSHRPCFEGMLWIVRTGARWKDLPTHYPSPSTCWRRLRAWAAHDVWRKVWRAFLGQLDAQGQLDWSDAFADGRFAPAKKGGRVSARPNGAQARSGWWWSTATVFLWDTSWTRRPPPQ